MIGNWSLDKIISLKEGTLLEIVVPMLHLYPLDAFESGAVDQNLLLLPETLAHGARSFCTCAAKCYFPQTVIRGPQQQVLMNRLVPTTVLKYDTHDANNSSQSKFCALLRTLSFLWRRLLGTHNGYHQVLGNGQLSRDLQRGGA